MAGQHGRRDDQHPQCHQRVADPNQPAIGRFRQLPTAWRPIRLEARFQPAWRRSRSCRRQPRSASSTMAPIGPSTNRAFPRQRSAETSCTEPTGGADQWVNAWYNNGLYQRLYRLLHLPERQRLPPARTPMALLSTCKKAAPPISTRAGGSLGISGLTPSADWEIEFTAATGSASTTTRMAPPAAINPRAPSTSPAAIPSTSPSSTRPGERCRKSLSMPHGRTYTTNYNIGDITALLGSSYAYVGLSRQFWRGRRHPKHQQL
jgi:hypothetical protein